MKYLSTCIAIALLGSTPITSKAEDSFQEEFDRLSAREQEAVRAEAVKKEDYGQLPIAPREWNSESVTAFCKLLPRGLETLAPAKLSRDQSAIERERTLLWARYLSCEDSLLYFEGHRFFKSGHYTDPEIVSAIAEIRKVMNWLIKQEETLESRQPKFTNVE